MIVLRIDFFETVVYVFYSFLFCMIVLRKVFLKQLLMPFRTSVITSGLLKTFVENF